jgi:cytoskeletal protein CcmA (bactofilin family)
MDKMLDEALNAQAETVVGPSVKIQGDLNSEGNIRVEGQVTGKINTSQSVFVNKDAHIIADVLAGNAVIGGEIKGNLKISGHLILQGSAKISGDISCSVLRVEDGAQFSGKCSMGGMVAGNGNGKKAAHTMEQEELAEEE